MLRKSFHTFICLLAIVLIVPFGTAVAQDAGMDVFAQDSAKFFVILDGKKLNEVAQSHVKLVELNSGRKRLKIIFEDQTSEEFSTSVSLPKGKSISYRLKPYDAEATNKAYKLTMMSEVSLSGYASTTTTDVEVNYGQAGDNVATLTSGLSSMDSAVTDGVDSAAIAGYTGIVGCAGPLGGGSFTTIENAVKSKMFESDKLDAAKAMVKDQCMMVKQVKALVEMFEFEDNKLDLAKYAYTYTYDVENYSQLLSAFYFSSSKDDLKTFIKSKR